MTDIALAALASDEQVVAAIEGGYIDKHGPSVLALATRGVAMFVLGHNLKCEAREYRPPTLWGLGEMRTELCYVRDDALEQEGAVMKRFSKRGPSSMNNRMPEPDAGVLRLS